MRYLLAALLASVILSGCGGLSEAQKAWCEQYAFAPGLPPDWSNPTDVHSCQVSWEIHH